MSDLEKQIQDFLSKTNVNKIHYVTHANDGVGDVHYRLVDVIRDALAASGNRKTHPERF